jgi:hypothetical protein
VCDGHVLFYLTHHHLAKHDLDFFDFCCLDGGIGLGQLLPPSRLVVKGAFVLIGVAMNSAELPGKKNEYKPSSSAERQV